MARLPIDLPRMQNQPRSRVPAARGPNLVPLDGETPAPKPRKPRKTRQYELIDQVKQYNPKANEELLNRAYVYAMRAHGGQHGARHEKGSAKHDVHQEIPLGDGILVHPRHVLQSGIVD